MTRTIFRQGRIVINYDIRGINREDLIIGNIRIQSVNTINNVRIHNIFVSFSKIKEKQNSSFDEQGAIFYGTYGFLIRNYNATSIVELKKRYKNYETEEGRRTKYLCIPIEEMRLGTAQSGLVKAVFSDMKDNLNSLLDKLQLVNTKSDREVQNSLKFFPYYLIEEAKAGNHYSAKTSKKYYISDKLKIRNKAIRIPIGGQPKR